jgi:hypothetical protein
MKSVDFTIRFTEPQLQHPDCQRNEACTTYVSIRWYLPEPRVVPANDFLLAHEEDENKQNGGLWE